MKRRKANQGGTLLLEIFDRWLIRRKINYLKGELAHAQDETTRRALLEVIAAEQQSVGKAWERKPDKGEAEH